MGRKQELIQSWRTQRPIRNRQEKNDGNHSGKSRRTAAITSLIRLFHGSGGRFLHGTRAWIKPYLELQARNNSHNGLIICQWPKAEVLPIHNFRRWEISERRCVRSCKVTLFHYDRANFTPLVDQVDSLDLLLDVEDRNGDKRGKLKVKIQWVGFWCTFLFYQVY